MNEKFNLKNDTKFFRSLRMKWIWSFCLFGNTLIKSIGNQTKGQEFSATFHSVYGLSVVINYWLFVSFVDI